MREFPFESKNLLVPTLAKYCGFLFPFFYFDGDRLLDSILTSLLGKASGIFGTLKL